MGLSHSSGAGGAVVTELLPRRGETRQDYQTPDDFLAAVVRRFGPLHVDLACTHANAVASTGCYYPGIDSLSVPWAEMWPDATMWLNPPFDDIGPWAAKCAAEGQRLSYLAARGVTVAPRGEHHPDCPNASPAEGDKKEAPASPAVN